jgi:hypothetical protein
MFKVPPVLLTRAGPLHEGVISLKSFKINWLHDGSVAVTKALQDCDVRGVGRV